MSREERLLRTVAVTPFVAWSLVLIGLEGVCVVNARHVALLLLVGAPVMTLVGIGLSDCVERRCYNPNPRRTAERKAHDWFWWKP